MRDFQIGIITKAQGIRGEFRVLPTTDDPARFELLVGEEVRVGDVACKVKSARLQKNIVVLSLDGVNDRNAAEKLIGAEIFIGAEKALPLDADEYYIRDLVGLRAEDENSCEIGILSQVLHTGANDVYVIKPPDGDSFMLPAIKDVVLSVNITEGKIIVRLMDGMKELLA